MLQRSFSFIFLLILCVGVSGKAQQVITFNSPTKILGIGEQILLLEDPKGSLTIDDVLTDSIQQLFKRSTAAVPGFGNTTSAIWCKFTVQNATDESCILEIKKSLIHQIELFRLYPDGKYRSTVTGALYPLTTRSVRDNYFIFKLLPPRSEATTFYIRLASEESLEIPIHVGSPTALFHEHKSEEIIFGFFYGLMVVMLIYNFFLFISIRERAYFYYVLYLISAIILNDMIVTGLAFEYIWPATPQINYYVNAVTGIFYMLMILFSSSFLETRTTTPTLHKGFYVFYGVCALIIVLNLGGDYFISSIISQIVGLCLIAYLTAIGITAFNRGHYIARYYLLAWGFLLISGLIMLMLMNGLIPSNEFTQNITLIGTALEVTLLSFALGDRINVLRKDKERGQRERMRLMEEHNTNLEKIVTQRTHEILTQNEEIASQNEELLSHQDQIKLQNEELTERNRQLEEAQGIIEIQHKTLKKYSENLEREVERRAFDLVQSNRELTLQNEQLEQFAFIAAHNLRAPVARIQGLSNLLDHLRHQPDLTESQFILEKIVESTRELDGVIFDLSRVLEIRKDTLQGFTNVNIEERIDRVLNLLRDDIDNRHIVISKDLKAKEFFSIPQYFESIVYNLVSNAIKFRRLSGQTEVLIKTWMDSNALNLMIRDTGVGIDMHQFKDKLFGLYQRFHTHVDGKGIGLHMVKTQVEALRGTIDVSSKPDEGTTFVVIIPSGS